MGLFRFFFVTFATTQGEHQGTVLRTAEPQTNLQGHRRLVWRRQGTADRFDCEWDWSGAGAGLECNNGSFGGWAGVGLGLRLHGTDAEGGAITVVITEMGPRLEQ